MTEVDLLRIEGLLASGPIALDRAALARLPGQVEDVGALARGKRGRGVRLASVLEHARASADARYLDVASHDPAFAVSVPIDAVRDAGIVVYEFDGGALPVAKGGPFRLVVAGHPDECVNVKALARLGVSAVRGRDTRPADDDEHRRLHERARERAGS